MSRRDPAVSQDGEFKNSRVEDFNLTQWNQEIAVGLTGAFLCAKHFGMLIKECGCGGVIINVSSDLGLIAPDQRLYSEDGDTERNRQVKPASYSVIKAGLIGLTRYFATYWPEFNIRCNAFVLVGFIVTGGEFVQRIEKLSEWAGWQIFRTTTAPSFGCWLIKSYSWSSNCCRWWTHSMVTRILQNDLPNCLMRCLFPTI